MGKRPPPPPLDVERGNYMAPRPGPPPIGPPPHRPWFSWLIPIFFFANVGMFVYVMYLNDCPANSGAKNCMLSQYLGRYSFQPFKQNPLLGPTPNTLLKLGALDRKLAVNGEWWRLFSCMWLHAGLIHLLANMLGLLVMGIRLERDFGFFRVGILYVLAGFGGSMVSALKNNSTISVGASGALFGLLGATLSELITNWTIYANKCAAFLNLIIVIIINLAIGFLPHVDSSAHIGGFVSGFFLGFVILVRSQFGYVSPKYIPKGYHVRPKPKFNCMQYILFFISVIIIVIGYTFGLGKLFNIPMFRTILPQIASG